MTTRLPAAAALILVSTSAALCAEQQSSASFSALGDGENGRSFDFDAAYAPSDAWQLGVGVGSNRARSAAGELDGTSLRASAAVSGERMGLRGYYRQWHSNALDTDTLGARASFDTGRVELAAILETQGLDVDYSTASSSPARVTEHFSGTGWGGGITYRTGRWTAHAQGIFYHYGTLSRYVESESAAPADDAVVSPPSSGLPTLPSLSIPISTPLPAPGAVAALPVLPGLAESVVYRVPTLSGSYVTLNQGVFDRLLSAGLERSFGRTSLRFDWTGARDAVLDTEIDSFIAGFQYFFSRRLSTTLSLGVSDSRYGSVNFGGVSFGVVL